MIQLFGDPCKLSLTGQCTASKTNKDSQAIVMIDNKNDNNDNNEDDDENVNNDDDKDDANNDHSLKKVDF